MAIKNKILVQEQVPDFIRSDAANFIKFLESYYEFLEQYNANVLTLRDLDRTQDRLVFFLKQEFANKFPSAKVDDRKLIPIIREVYNKKGTVEAIELLFKIFFDTSVIVEQPNKYILRASNGVWNQESSITLEPRYGLVDLNSPIVLTVENDTGKYALEVDKAELVEDSHYRFFFKTFRSVPLEPDQFIDIVNDAGIITFRGKLVKSPSSISVIRPGKAWKKGQVFFYPSATGGAPSLIRATDVGPEGELLKTEIVEIGIGHSENQQLTVSPYANKPAGANFDIAETVTGYNPITEQFTYNYQLTISDVTNGISEEISGLTTSFGENYYFLEDYAERDYVARLAFYTKTQQSVALDNSQLVDPDLSLEEWLQSRAVLQYNFSYKVDYLGTYLNNQSHLSDPLIRLQDSYFYQLFSYVINSEISLTQYRGVLSEIHAAGLKFFANYNKTAMIESNAQEIFREISRSKLFRFDEVIVEDQIGITVNRPISGQDSATPADSTPELLVGLTPTNEAITAQDNSNIFDISKVADQDSISANEQVITSVTATMEVDAALASADIPTTNVTKTADQDIAQAVDETPGIEINKVATQDSSAITDGVATSAAALYNAEGYFANDSGNYMATEYLVTIG